MQRQEAKSKMHCAVKKPRKPHHVVRNGRRFGQALRSGLGQVHAEPRGKAFTILCAGRCVTSGHLPVEEEDPAVVGNALVEHRKTSGRPEMSRPGKYMLNPRSLWRNLALLSRVMRCAESQVFHAFLTTPRAAAWLHKRAPFSAQGSCPPRARGRSELRARPRQSLRPMFLHFHRGIS